MAVVRKLRQQSLSWVPGLSTALLSSILPRAMRSDPSTAQPRETGSKYALANKTCFIGSPNASLMLPDLSQPCRWISSCCLQLLKWSQASKVLPRREPCPACPAVCDRTRTLHTFLQPGRGHILVEEHPARRSWRKLQLQWPPAHIQAVPPWHGQTAPQATGLVTPGL